jgi:hypothetical protein
MLSSWTRIIILLVSVTSVSVNAAGSAFTYQGQLKRDGAAADGPHDFVFELYDAPAGGTRKGQSVSVLGSPVSNGLFMVELDFGFVFDGTALWLQIEVRAEDDAAYTVLSPRQPVTAAPYAIYAFDGAGGSGDGSWVDVGTHIRNVNSGNVGIGTTPEYNLHVRESAAPGGGQPAATLGLHWSEASVPPIEDWLSMRVGGSFIVPVGEEGTHIIRKAGGKLHFSVETTRNSGTPIPQATISAEGRLGLGTTVPAADLHLYHPGNSVGEVRISSPGGYPGIIGLANNGMRRDIRFMDTGLGLFARNSSSAPPAGSGVFISGAGDVGIGTTSPEAKMHLVGGSDAEPAGGGHVVLGAVSGTNIAIDDNEIMARNNGQPSTLYLNNDGGDVVVGGHLDIAIQIVEDHTQDELGATAVCPDGTRLISGGCSSTGTLRQSSSGGGTRSWFCLTDGSASNTTATAFCARIR